MRRLLLVTYHFPPAGGAGTLRALRFARYLLRYGWQPEVVCVQPLPDVTLDASLQQLIPSEVPVHAVSSLEPGRFADSWERPGQKIIRNLFRTFDFLLVPDEQVGWVRPAVRRCLALERERGGFDAILTTGPPFSTHLIGLEVRRRRQIPWIADFRDDWIGFNDTLRGGAQRRRPQFERRLEEEVLRNADVVLTINESIAQSIGRRSSTNVEVIPNGYDPKDFEYEPASRPADRPFVICHAGTLYEQRSPANFLEGLRRLAARQDLRGRLEARFLGRIVAPVPTMLSSPDLEGIVRYDGIVPHSESVRATLDSDALLLIIDQVRQAEQIWTGKVFEYIAARRPILGLMPTDGSLADVLREDSPLHQVVASDAPDEIAGAIDRLMAHRDVRLPVPSPAADRFRADRLTERLAHLLEDVAAARAPRPQTVYAPTLDPR